MSRDDDRRLFRTRLWRSAGGELAPVEDVLAREEPLELRLAAGGETRSVAVTMRTPGADADLALGFLLAEGVIERAGEVQRIEELEDAWAAPGEPGNVLVVHLDRDTLPDLAALERHFFASSSCGVCGRAGIANLKLRLAQLPEGRLRITRATLTELPARLRTAQDVFAATGGLHAAALFTATGELLAVREDIGRHNAIDKLVGWALSQERLPLVDAVLLVSGRASFEVLQKAVAAGIPLVAAVSAPSSLAVELARELGVTLVGFLREQRFNVYACPGRIVE